MNYKFTTIITQEGKWYVARCAELGVVSQGKNIEDAERNLKEAAELYLEDQPRLQVRHYLSQRAPLVTTLEVRHG
ncbi:MAG: type II toxin-antitoxin system HicB family antitoxin [Parcubacteria group bacterium]|nr:type II toxin-antitoxin system HicB family antitoxin [Parcubacteria group bacterium]